MNEMNLNKNTIKQFGQLFNNLVTAKDIEKKQFVCTKK